MGIFVGLVFAVPRPTDPSNPPWNRGLQHVGRLDQTGLRGKAGSSV